MIIVTGSVVVRDSDIDEAIRVSLEHVHRSRTEPGCIQHGVYRDVENPHRLFFYEEWADRAALDVHFGVAASGEFVTAVSALAVDSPSINIREAQ